MNKKTIQKEHRLLDDTDLNNINNTFEKIDVTFKSIEKTCESMNNHMNSLEKTMNTRVDSLEKSVNNKHNTLVILISVVGIILTALKIFIN